MLFFDIDLETPRKKCSQECSQENEEDGRCSQENEEDGQCSQENEEDGRCSQENEEDGRCSQENEEDGRCSQENEEDGRCSQENEEDKQEPGLQKGQRKGKKTPWSQQDNKLLRDKFPLYFKNIVNVIHKHDLELIIPLLDGPRTVAQIRTKLNNMKLGKSK